MCMIDWLHVDFILFLVERCYIIKWLLHAFYVISNYLLGKNILEFNFHLLFLLFIFNDRVLSYFRLLSFVHSL